MPNDDIITWKRWSPKCCRRKFDYIHELYRSYPSLPNQSHGWSCVTYSQLLSFHDDVIKWKHLPRYWPFVRGIHQSPVNSPRKGQWREALVFSLIYVWINGWVKNREAGDFRCYRAHYDVTVMWKAVKSSRVHDINIYVSHPVWITTVTLLVPSVTFEVSRYIVASRLSW